MSYNVVLINPNTLGNYRKAKIATANFGIAFLSAYLKKFNDCKVHILDARYLGLSSEKAFEQLKGIKPDLVGLSLCVDESSPWTSELIELLKKAFPYVHITLGNYFPSIFVEKALKKFPLADSVILGEGEQTLSTLVHALQYEKNWKELPGLAFFDQEQSKIQINAKQSLIDNLDEIPYADRYLPIEKQELTEVMLEGTRGCAFNCAFCAVRPFTQVSKGKIIRIRSAENIFREIEGICRKYPKIRSFRFVDPDFIAPYTKERAKEFISLLKNSDLDVDLMMDTRASSIKKNEELLKEFHEVGLKRLYIGIESGSDAILKKMRKGVASKENLEGMTILKKLKIDFSYGFMMVTPWTTEEDIEKNIEMLRKIGSIEFRSLFHELTLIPGTAAYKEQEKLGRLKWSGHLYYYTYETTSKKVETFRRLNQLLQKKYSECFGFAAGYIYEGIRQSKRLNDNEFASRIEEVSDQLFLDVFDMVWNEAGMEIINPIQDEKFVDMMYQKFSPKFLNLLKEFDPKIDFSNVKDRMPKNVPRMQI